MSDGGGWSSLGTSPRKSIHHVTPGCLVQVGRARVASVLAGLTISGRRREHPLIPTLRGCRAGGKIAHDPPREHKVL